MDVHKEWLLVGTFDAILDKYVDILALRGRSDKQSVYECS